MKRKDKKNVSLGNKYITQAQNNKILDISK